MAYCHRPLLASIHTFACILPVQLDPQVIRIPIVPGSDPRLAYGDLTERGIRGVVLEVRNRVGNGVWRDHRVEWIDSGSPAIDRMSTISLTLGPRPSTAGFWRRQHPRRGSVGVVALAPGPTAQGAAGIIRGHREHHREHDRSSRGHLL